MKKRLPFLEAVSIIVATVVGAGVLGVPYVFSLGNFYSSTLILVLVVIGMLMTKLFLGEVVLRTSARHQISGYAEIYLGKLAKWIHLIVLILGIYGALLAYTIGEGRILSSILDQSETFWTLVFYTLFSLLIWRGMVLIKKVELLLIVAIFSVLTFLTLSSAGHIDLSLITGNDFSHLFLSYGVILFACAGTIAIPHAHDILVHTHSERKLKWAIILGMLLPAILYFVFALVVVGVTGSNTTEIGTLGLGQALGPQVTLLGSLFAFIAMSTSFLSLGLALKNIFRYDMGITKQTSFWLVVGPPILLYFLLEFDFITILSIVGALSVGISGILIVFMFWRARTLGEIRPSYTIPSSLAVPTSIFLIAMYALGICFVLV